MAPSNRWILGGILLLPGLVIALSLQIFDRDSVDNAVAQALNLNQMPPTSAGSTKHQAAEHPSEWGISLSSSVVTTKEKVIIGEATGQMSVQLEKYRFRWDEKILAGVSFELESGKLPSNSEMIVSITTQQGNLIQDVTPAWTKSGNRTHGLISVLPNSDWPANIEVVVTLKVPQQGSDESTALRAHETKVPLELFSPKIIVTGVASPYIEGDDWVVPIEITVHEPGVAVVSARLIEDNGTLVSHLQSRSRLTEDGLVLMHVRKQLITEKHYKQNLMLTDITVRHIADGLNAKLGWGDATRAKYVIPKLTITPNN